MRRNVGALVRSACLFVGMGFICTSFVYANKIVDVIEKETGQNVTVLKEQTLNQDSNLKLVVFKEQSSGYKILAVVNKQESIFLPITSSFFTSDEKDRNTVFQEFRSVSAYNVAFKTHGAVKEAIASLPSDYIIHLKGKNDKKVFYIVSDPLCPHCQVELNNIEEKLSQGDVKMIPVAWMGDDSVNRVAGIYTQIKTAKTDSEKIAILKKFYNKKHKAQKADEKDVARLKEVVRILMGPGKVESTPYIIEEDL